MEDKFTLENKILLDRAEVLFPSEDLSSLRRACLDKDLSSLFSLVPHFINPEDELIGRVNSEVGLDVYLERLRSASLTNNVHAVFALYELFTQIDSKKNGPSLTTTSLKMAPEDYHERLRSAVLTQNLHAVFALFEAFTPVEGIEQVTDLRKFILNGDLYAFFRLVPCPVLKAMVMRESRRDALKVVIKWTESSLFKGIYKLCTKGISFEKDFVSRGQLESKKWLIEIVKQLGLDLGDTMILAGWYGTLGTMLKDNGLNFKKLRSFDIDRSCEKVADILNHELLYEGWRFKSFTYDIHDVEYENFNYFTLNDEGERVDLTESFDTIINTSCEHIENFDKWWNKVPKGKLVILQSNNDYARPEHINCHGSLESFCNSLNCQEYLFKGELDLEHCTRFMVIGRK